ncbi:sigma-70 family RNA polymerase sigma factor [bacterium]|jgi:RNA polymerase sigma factor (sigma-70 family)|nr:sigma-70 family RNA polymerase sigma factor [bacterium]
MTKEKSVLNCEIDYLNMLREGNRDTCLLIERWSSQVAYSRFYGIPIEDRREIVQDVLVKILESVNKPNFVIRVSLKALVRQITMTKCIDWLRKQRPMVRDYDEKLIDKDNPYKNAINNDKKNILNWAIMSLTNSCKNLIKQHFLKEISYSELAKTDGTEITTVRVKVHRCINKLRVFFKQQGLEL